LQPLQLRKTLKDRSAAQVEAQHTKLAVSASTQYATNAKYVEVNSGRHPQIAVFPGMHALSPDEVDVFSSLVDKCPSSRVTVLHHHCMSEQVIGSLHFACAFFCKRGCG
jgi:hypothetical protein